MIGRFDDVRRRVRAELRPLLSVGIGSAARLTERAGGRFGVSTDCPSASEIVSQYTSGWVLFGVPHAASSRLEWRRFPRRAVITRETVHVPKRLRSVQRRGELELRYGEDFDAILEHCREGRDGWLTEEAVAAYRSLHDLGFVATVATYRDDRLVGGMWGIAIGEVLGIMSMFHLEDHAGALALAAVADKVAAGERWSLVDCGVLNENFKRYGAYEVTNDEFCELVWKASRPSSAQSG